MPLESTERARRRAHRPELPEGAGKRPGASQVTRAELRGLSPPPRSHTWQPLSHDAVATMVEDALETAGRRVEDARYLVSRAGRRFAAVFTLNGSLAVDVSPLLVVRSNMDRSGAITLAFGGVLAGMNARWIYHTAKERVRYTPGILARLPERLERALDGLPLEEEKEAGYLRRFQQRPLSPAERDALALGMWYESHLSNVELRALVAAWQMTGLRRWGGFSAWDFLVSACRVMATRWRKDVEAFRASENVRWHLATCLDDE